MNTLLKQNIKVHDKVARKYDKIHTEIYNKHEQDRLCAELSKARDFVATDTSREVVQAFDFGCGAGNLTKHLLEMDCHVCCADVSQNFLDLVTEEFSDKKDYLSTHKLNGVDLSDIADNTFDMVVTYSVLHHIPDYKSAVHEMIRVLKPGGIIFIDHERNDNYWSHDSDLYAYYKKNKAYSFFKKLSRLFKPGFYINRLKRMKNPRYQSEGDIHVFEDDHIEWDDIKKIFVKENIDMMYQKDYLLYDAVHKYDLYREYKDSISDMKVVIGRKQ